MNRLDEAREPTIAEETFTPPQLMQRLPQLLRLAGAAALLVAMYSFLVQGWQDSNDLLRYVLLLGHSLLLCGLGLASGHWLREPRGARLLTSLSLVSVPVNFAILGAFLYARLGSGLPSYPDYAHWQLDSLTTTGVTVGVATLLLAPLTWLGFRILARPLGKSLSLLYLAGNVALLIPVRDPTLIAAMALPLALLTLANNERNREQHLCARTPDGMLARLLQYLPPAILMGRSLWLYDAGAFLFTSSLLILFLAARQLSLLLPGQSILRGLLEVGSALLTPLIATGTVVLLDGWLAEELLLPAASLLAATLLYELSTRVKMAPPLYRVMSMLALVGGLLGNLVLFGGPGTALTAIVAGAVLATLGRLGRHLLLFASGLLIAACGLVYLLFRILVVFDLGGWLSLALIGMLAILVGSMLESRGGRLGSLLPRWRRRFARWQL
ncbi:hypothetical protein [Marinobacterium aestuariivivens]|uniref:DUF2157 domain-containing protein n=1 Tax=Marinobacterium aestuariivivens TaxID=1698799 RepID=A0ABW2A194_9GAMM